MSKKNETNKLPAPDAAGQQGVPSGDITSKVAVDWQHQFSTTGTVKHRGKRVKVTIDANVHLELDPDNLE